MRFSGVLSLSFLLVGANAGVLEDNGYIFKDLGDGLCTVISEESSGYGQPDEFKVNKEDKSMTIINFNYVGDEDPDQLSTSAIMAAVSRKYDLEPDNLSKVTMTLSKDDCLEYALETYRWLHRDLEYDEKIDATLTRPLTNLDPDREAWLEFHECMPITIVNRMLTKNSIVNKIHIKEGDYHTCLISYFIEADDEESKIHNFDELGHRHSES